MEESKFVSVNLEDQYPFIGDKENLISGDGYIGYILNDSKWKPMEQWQRELYFTIKIGDIMESNIVEQEGVSWVFRVEEFSGFIYLINLTNDIKYRTIIFPTNNVYTYIMSELPTPPEEYYIRPKSSENIWYPVCDSLVKVLNLFRNVDEEKNWKYGESNYTINRVTDHIYYLEKDGLHFTIVYLHI